MELNYWTGPKIVTKISYVLHKRRTEMQQTDFHTHPTHEIILVDHGRVDVSFNGITRYVGSGECIFIPNTVRHKVCARGEEFSNFVNILFRGRFLPELSGEAVPLTRPMRETVARLKEIASPPLHPLRSELAACLLTEFILLACQPKKISETEPVLMPLNRQHYRSEVVNHAMEYLRKNHDRKISLEKLSEHVGLSASHLRRLLRLETGANFSTQIQRIRIETAKEILQNGSDNLENIAARCGYQSLPFFFKIFKRHAGMTPLEYAKSFGDPET